MVIGNVHMVLITAADLAPYQRETGRIRNICILAHVDHGKTTLSDYLISSNGLISSKLAGKVRFLDSREDEQERCITMKSSCISLLYPLPRSIRMKALRRGPQRVMKPDTEPSPVQAVDCTAEPEPPIHLINLIDSPGHVDFSSEVSAAVRLTDGALVLIDALEGVCIQTEQVMRQANEEGIPTVLVINKIDRLITELRFSPAEMYEHLRRTLEEVNVVQSTIRQRTASGTAEAEDNYYAPEKGNVVFASAADGWAFRISDFATMFSKKMGMSREVLIKTLWGPYYINMKQKSIQKISVTRKGGSGPGKTPLFVQMIAESIYKLYGAVYDLTDGVEDVTRPDVEHLQALCTKLEIDIPAKELKAKAPRAVCSHGFAVISPVEQCFSIDSSIAYFECDEQMAAASDRGARLGLYAIVDAVSEILPSPIDAQKSRCDLIMPALSGTESVSESTGALQTGRDSACLGFVRHCVQTCDKGEDVPIVAYVAKLITVDSMPGAALSIALTEMKQSRLMTQMDSTDADVNSVSLRSENFFVGFARIYSGSIRVGDKITLIVGFGPHAKRYEIEVPALYLLMGRGLEPVQEVPAGNIFGIGGVAKFVPKACTVSTIAKLPPIMGMHFPAAPIVRVAVEPENPLDLPSLVEGLRLLNQADPSVKVSIEETGEHVVAAAGEVHLERCLKDLRESYAKIPIQCSAPIVMFRECINMATEAQKRKILTCVTANQYCHFSIRAIPLPEKISTFLLDHEDELQDFVDETSDSSEDDKKFREELEAVFTSEGSYWGRVFSSIWTFGPNKCGPNCLAYLNKEGASPYTPHWKGGAANVDSKLAEIALSVIAGFELGMKSGPLCEEPLVGVCIALERFEFDEDWNPEMNGGYDPYGPLSGQIMSCIKEGIRESILNSSPRLVEAIYKCDIQTTADALGKVYGVLSKRRAKIVDEIVPQDLTLFTVSALLPVAESFGLADELRKKTSGAAQPQLMLSHWQLLDEDPFWIPKTEDELEEHGAMDSSQTANVARKLMDDVRRRKGLLVEEQIIESGSKQRTLSRKK